MGYEADIICLGEPHINMAGLGIIDSISRLRLWVGFQNTSPPDLRSKKFDKKSTHHTYITITPHHLNAPPPTPPTQAPHFNHVKKKTCWQLRVSHKADQHHHAHGDDVEEEF